MAKKYFICKICGDIHWGDLSPELCPTCETKDAYQDISKEDALKKYEE
jgi:rubrerythrin